MNPNSVPKIVAQAETSIMKSTRSIMVAMLLALCGTMAGYGAVFGQEKKDDKSADEHTQLNEAFSTAAALGKLEAVKDLLKKGADIQWQDPTHNRKTPLVKAVMSGKVAVVKYLLEQGADIHHPDGSGRYPIFFCCIANNAEMLNFLIANGGDKDVNKGPFPMLVTLCDHGQAPADLIPIVIKAGVSPDEFNHEGFTPLVASMRLNPKVRKAEVSRSYVKALIENKADVNLKDKKEKMSPLQWARKRGDNEIIEMLVKAGAKAHGD
jgi:ankyrin repeat protein